MGAITIIFYCMYIPIGLTEAVSLFGGHEALIVCMSNLHVRGM